MAILPTFQSQDPVAKIALHLSGLRENINRVLKENGKPEDSVTLMASGRALMADPVTHAAKAGVKHICEEFLPEGVAKRPVVDQKVPGLAWHFTGSLLGKKIGLAVEFFDWIHSVDRVTLISDLRRAVLQKARRICVLIEVNPLGDEKRLGVSEKDLPELAEALIQIPEIQLMGLSFKTEQFMSSSAVLEGFETMARIQAEGHRKGFLPPYAKDLAMGSSRDYLQAVSTGSTILRVGSALFGEDAYHVMGGNELELFDL